MPARAKTGKRKRGRPALKPAQRKRSNITIRFRDETKTNVQRAASAAGRSLSEEVEARVEQWGEYDRQFGGRELHSLFRMMGAAAQIIEERKSQSCITDFETLVIVKACWLQLISLFSPMPRLGSKYIKSIGGPPSDFKLPPHPTPPAYPTPSDRLVSRNYLLLARESAKELAEEIAAYEKKLAAYEKAKAKWDKDIDEFQNKVKAVQQRFKALEDHGKKVAVDLFHSRTGG